MARARLGLVGAGCALLMLGPLIADAQQSVSDLLGRPATAEGQPKSYLEELSLFGYVDDSRIPLNEPLPVIAAGLAGGLAYWAIAGWSAGFWKPVFRSESVAVPARVASHPPEIR